MAAALNSTRWSAAMAVLLLVALLPPCPALQPLQAARLISAGQRLLGGSELAAPPHTRRRLLVDGTASQVALEQPGGGQSGEQAQPAAAAAEQKPAAATAGEGAAAATTQQEQPQQAAATQQEAQPAAAAQQQQQQQQAQPAAAAAAADGQPKDQPPKEQTAAAAVGGGGEGGQAGQPSEAAAGAGEQQIPPTFTVAVPQQGPEAYVAICAAVKDQHIDVREWIFYHRALGIDKFYLTDTGSKPPMQSVLDDHINAGLVEYTYDTQVPHRVGTHGPQVTVYDRCLAQHGHRHTFMAFIDVDEFLLLRDGTPDIPTLLQDYEAYGGLAVNWVMFGSSGIKERPAGNTLMSYWKCAPEQHSENCHIKSIVRPPHVNNTTTDPHAFKYNPGMNAVNTRYEVVKGPKSQNVTIERVGLYHYSIKSFEDFKLKMARGSGMGNQKTIDYLYYIDNFTTADCLDAIDVGVQMASFAVY